MGGKVKGLLGKILDSLPGVGGKRAYNRARDYANRVHASTPEELEAYKRAGDRSYDIKSKMSRFTNEENDRTTDHQFKNQVLGFPTDMPNRFIYQNKLSDMNKMAINETTFGTEAGHKVTRDGRFTRAVDKDNVAQGTPGKHFMGVIPYGWRGSVKKNPGIDPRIDTEYYKKQIDASGLAPLSRLDLYRGRE
jgi:hypothetical protein